VNIVFKSEIQDAVVREFRRRDSFITERATGRMSKLFQSFIMTRTNVPVSTARYGFSRATVRE
jgi:hypothetical protein